MIFCNITDKATGGKLRYASQKKVSDFCFSRKWLENRDAGGKSGDGDCESPGKTGSDLV